MDVFLGSFISAFATGLGAIPILYFNHLPHRVRDILIALTAGIMVAASTFSLLPEALQSSNIWVVSIGVLIGTLLMFFLEWAIPHVDLERGPSSLQIDPKALFIIAAITLHNVPEGLSVGVSYAGDNGSSLGVLVSIAIGLQNMPEGFLVALYLVNQNISRWKALGLATMTGAIELIAALGGYFLTNWFDQLVPYGLSFAAGAMLYIVYKELIPESHGHGYERPATFAFIMGLLLMIFLTKSI
ncbi:ZIP family metal transporter [Risungbinella massiliensis]|uniref:ZIP family metal transporter n=1 Tax=Risungbinella massiliensis TaxID=1329796 RepID=UPI0005CBBECF|nr:ZIP family metal transporter [Risungbinella massiliensis]